MKSLVIFFAAMAYATPVLDEQPEKSLCLLNVDVDVEDHICLLNVAQRRHQRFVGDAIVNHLEISSVEFNEREGINLNISDHRDWLMQYAGVERTMNNSLDDVERMADEHDKRTQQCGQRLEDVKAKLKNLVDRTTEFSGKVKDHEKKLIEYKRKLNGSETQLTKFEAEHEKTLDSCKEQQAQAEKDQERYAKAQGELKRLAAGVSDGEGMAVLLQMAAATAVHQEDYVWNKDICLSFLAFLKKNEDLKLAVSAPPTEDCTTHLASVKKLFATTIASVSDLEKAAAMRAEKKLCDDTAQTVKSASITPMVAERENISEKIIEATNSLALMRPIFNRLGTQVKDFDKYVKNNLAPECDKAAKVGKSLRAIKDLMASLAKCPGKDGRAVLLTV